MLEIGFGLLRDNTHLYWYNDIIRIVFSLLERVVFTIIPFVYQVLIKIAESQIISGTMIKNIFRQVQLILGIIMIFKLSISVLQYIIDPDSMDDKSKGFGNVVTRIIVMLVLFTAVIPLNIPKRDIVEGSYNYYLSESGLLFGTLYSFQSRILRGNVLANLMLGTNESMTSADAVTAGDELSVAVLKVFIRKNNYTADGGEAVCPADEIDTDYFSSEEKDSTEDEKIYKKYDGKLDVDGDGVADPMTPNELLDAMLYVGCYTGGWGPDGWPSNAKPGRYAFTYLPFVGGVVGLFLLLILISFCIEVAIRAIKLAVLRLIAPIPIISYIDPKSSQNGPFSSWIKAIVKTYVDLFIRLGIIYFVIAVVKQITELDKAQLKAMGFDFSTIVGSFATIFIIIGLFYFAKQAPQFIYDSLGLKYEKGKGVFSGFSKMLAPAVALGGAIGSARTNYKAYQQEHPDQPGLAAASGLVGGISGAFQGLKAAMNAEDHQTQAAINAMNQRNARRASHSTAFGRLGANLSAVTGGMNAHERDQDRIDALESYQNMFKRMEAKADADGNYKFFEIKDANGNVMKDANGNAIKKSVKALKIDYENLQHSSTATQAQIAKAREDYESAQKQYFADVINGNENYYKKNADGTYANSMAGEVISTYEKMSRIAQTYEIPLGNTGSTGMDFKISYFNAGDLKNNLQESNLYKAHKADHDFANKK